MISIESIWPEWKIEKLIGEGGFGKVFEASRNRFGIEEHRAVKVISIPAGQAEYEKTLNDGMDGNSAFAYYKSMVDEFVKEIALLSQLRGVPNIVVYDDYKVVEHEGAFGWDIYIMMELLTPLTEVLRNGALTSSEVVKLGSDICDALSVCHSKNILHRDIKIDNIFVSDDGVYKLGDFGIARRAEQTMGVYTKTGTESYMAPEVYKGEPYGKRADIYSLGMVLYRVLNDNRDPFLPKYPHTITVTDKNNSTVKRMKGEPLPLPKNADNALGQVILKACAYSQNNRYTSAEEFKKSLQSKVVIDSPVYSKNLSGAPAEDITEKTISAFGDSKSYNDNFGNKDLSNENGIASKKKKNIAVPIIIAVTAFILAAGVFIIVSMLNSKNNVSTSNLTNRTPGTTVTATQKATAASTEKATEITKKTVSHKINGPADYMKTGEHNATISGNGKYNVLFCNQIENTNTISFSVEVLSDCELYIKIDGVLYYECSIDYKSGSIKSYQTYEENFSTAESSRNTSSKSSISNSGSSSTSSKSSNSNSGSQSKSSSSTVGNNYSGKDNIAYAEDGKGTAQVIDDGSADYTDGDNIAYAEDGAQAFIVDDEQ